MAITWGRKPDPLASTGAWRVPFALALVAASVVSAFAPAEPPPPPNAITPGTQGELQALLDLHVDRVVVRDHTGYALTIDPTREAYVSCMRERFALPDRATALRPARVVRIEPVGSTYLRAVVQERDGLVERFFRRAGVTWNQAKPPFYIWRESWRWYLSVPLPQERPAAAITQHEGAPVRPDDCAM